MSVRYRIDNCVDPVRGGCAAAHARRRTVGTVIPLPRAWQLTGAMLIGAAVGVVLGVVAMLQVEAALRPDAVIALVLGVPTVLGLLFVLTASRPWITALGASILAVAPGWFAVLVLIQVVHGG